MIASRCAAFCAAVGIALVSLPDVIWSQAGPIPGAGFVLVPDTSDLTEIGQLEGRTVCGRAFSVQAFQEVSGVTNLTHHEMPFHEGIVGLETGICDAVIAYSEDLGRVRGEVERWERTPGFRPIPFTFSSQ